jgi:transcriptional regulator with XRE-family HTH domain
MAEQWWFYVQRHLDERGWTPTDLSKQAGINRSIIGRWREGAQPEVRTAKALARAFGRPVLEVLVASGLLDPDEAGVEDVIVLRVGEISDEELLSELTDRLRSRHGNWELSGEPEVGDAYKDAPVRESDPDPCRARRPSGGRKAT